MRCARISVNKYIDYIVSGAKEVRWRATNNRGAVGSDGAGV